MALEHVQNIGAVIFINAKIGSGWHTHGFHDGKATAGNPELETARRFGANRTAKLVNCGIDTIDAPFCEVSAATCID